MRIRARSQLGRGGAVLLLYNVTISRCAAHDGPEAKAGHVDHHRVGDGAVCVDSLMHAGGVVGVAASSASERVRMAARLC